MVLLLFIAQNTTKRRVVLFNDAVSRYVYIESVVDVSMCTELFFEGCVQGGKRSVPSESSPGAR